MPRIRRNTASSFPRVSPSRAASSSRATPASRWKPAWTIAIATTARIRCDGWPERAACRRGGCHEGLRARLALRPRRPGRRGPRRAAAVRQAGAFLHLVRGVVARAGRLLDQPGPLVLRGVLPDRERRRRGPGALVLPLAERLGAAHLGGDRLRPRRAQAGSAPARGLASIADLREGGARGRSSAFRPAGRAARRRSLHRPRVRACRRSLRRYPRPAQPVGVPAARPRPPALLRAAPARRRRAGSVARLLRRGGAVIALAAALAAAPFAGAFWGRDLGAVARELADRRGGEGAALFDDLLRLCDCEPLPPLPAADPLRQLVRVEAARRARLGSRAAASETLWRDVLRKDFFRRDPGNPPLASALRWPDEEEVWTGEVRLVDPPRWRCDQPGKPPPAQDDAPLAESLRASGSVEAASRFAYYRASRLLAGGDKVKAAEQARAVDPAVLGPLGPW